MYVPSSSKLTFNGDVSENCIKGVGKLKEESGGPLIILYEFVPVPATVNGMSTEVAPQGALISGPKVISYGVKLKPMVVEAALSQPVTVFVIVYEKV